MRYWLMKTEPDAFSIDDLKRLKKDAWSGVRNYQARNFMKEMRLGDLVLFYHSSTTPPGVAGLAKVVALAHPDETQFEKKGKYFDPKATKAKPIWHCVDVGFVKKFPRLIPLDELRGVKALKDMVLLRRGSRLSVQPVTEKEFDGIIKLSQL
ncbi:MAG: EVE domain-containing protein [Patescibacteria group bacterium]|nr:MAG: EVE domain-containing protein [Patescibacteria group bacterium]